MISILFLLFVTALCAIVYFAPWICACVLHRKNVVAIAALNVLAGWTVVGWIAALVWALVEE
jgi:hypothetical protein